MLEKMRSFISEQLNCDESEINPETDFREDLGADSLDLYQIKMGIEEEFGLTIPDEKVAGVKTVGDALTMIKEAVA